MNRHALILTVSAVALAGLACRDDAPKPANAFATVSPTPAAGGAAPEGSLPEGHPPTDGGAAMPAGMGGSPHGGAPAMSAGSVAWEPPSSWKSEKPSSGMRRAQYKVPGPGGDGECVVFYFGPGEGGDAQANAERWADQFTTADGQSARSALKTSELEGATLPATLVEVKGTYMGGIGSATPEPQKNSALLGAIVQGADANWFFKFVGPAATVDANRDAFVAMIKNAKKGS